MSATSDFKNDKGGTSDDLEVSHDVSARRDPTPRCEFLPIVAAYVNKLGIVDEVNRLCPTMSDLSAGQVVKALILDTLSGRC